MLEKQNRLLSLDVFRGLAIAGMIMADFPGSWSHMFPFFQHANWNGCTQTDLVFPFFLFMVGISIKIALSKKINDGSDTKSLIGKIIKRSIGLFLIGVFLNLWPFFSYYGELSFVDFTSFRLLGVLQRIAIVYLASSLLFIYLNQKQLIITGVLILLGYWGIMTLIPIPGFGMPDLSIRPDGVTSNLAAWIDSVVLGPFVWEYSKPWDPEGLLSTVPAVVTCLIGVITGSWLTAKQEPAIKTVWMFVYGALLLLIGYAWDYVFPINKSIWTSSFVVFTGGWALTFYAVLYWFIDVQGYNKYLQPLSAYGKNALGVFAVSWFVENIFYNIGINLGPEMISLKDFIYQTFYESWLTPIFASAFYGLTVVTIGTISMWILDKKKITLKI